MIQRRVRRAGAGLELVHQPPRILDVQHQLLLVAQRRADVQRVVRLVGELQAAHVGLAAEQFLHFVRPPEQRVTRPFDARDRERPPFAASPS